MWCLDRNGNRGSGYINSDCVFVEVVDIDQDEDQYRRERIEGFWDLARDGTTITGGQNWPFGPTAHDGWDCGPTTGQGHHVFNNLLGHTSIFTEWYGPKLYVLNPRSGYWASVDLLETGVATGDFVSVTCIDLASVYECAPSLAVQPGDTIVAFYQDPSNHSDSAMISIKVGIGGGGPTPGQLSTTMFVDADGNEVDSYTDTDLVYVRVVDPSHPATVVMAGAVVEIDGEVFALTGLGDHTFGTTGLDLGLAAGDTITATYTDPTDPTDTSSDTITVIASELDVEAFFAGPSPFDGNCTFGFDGTGVATVMSVVIYDFSGHEVWVAYRDNVSEIVWDGTDATGAPLANGGYIYVIRASDGTNTFDGKGTVFVNR